MLLSLVGVNAQKHEVYKDLRIGKKYVNVDGVLHSITPAGDPNLPVRPLAASVVRPEHVDLPSACDIVMALLKDGGKIDDSDIEAVAGEDLRAGDITRALHDKIMAKNIGYNCFVFRAMKPGEQRIDNPDNPFEWH